MIARLAPRLLLAALLVATAVVHIRGREAQRKQLFDPKRSEANLRLLLHKQKPAVGTWEEQKLDDALAQWQLTGPVSIALPPMYTGAVFGNAGYLMSFVNHGETLLYNGPFPHPKLEITERFAGPSNLEPYSFDNKASNAALFVSLGRHTWPFGYTAWYDLVLLRQIMFRKTPRLIDAHGSPIEATAVYTVNPLNRADLGEDSTRIELGHLSPIVWIFPSEGTLSTGEEGGEGDEGYVVDSIADGAEVSWMPSLPLAREQPLGMFLLGPRLPAPTNGQAPPWWSVDEQLRRAIVDERPIDERRQLLQKLARAFPGHPMLPHYRIVSELGSDRFDAVWLDAQAKSCDLPTWYLVAWTKLPWSRVQRLSCLQELPAGPFDARGQYIAESVVLAYHALTDDEQLKELASRDADASYLRKEFRGFNYAPSNFAWLWLEARP